MKSDDFESENCVVDGEPKHHVLAGDPAAMALFDALAEKGVHSITAVFRIEEGSPRIDVWDPVPTKRRKVSANTLKKQVRWHRADLVAVIRRGLELSLAGVWGFENDLIADVYVDVESRCLHVEDIRELMFESDLPNPEGGIDL